MTLIPKSRAWRVTAFAALSALTVSACGSSYSQPTSHTIRHPHSFLASLGSIANVGSTVPANGDVNPYGIAMVSTSVGRLVRGSALVSNFNSSANIQGTGTTLVEVAPSGQLTLFAKVDALPSGMNCPGGIGLSTALAILPGGYVVVGSEPAVGPSGAPAPVNPSGCLLVLNSSGVVVAAWTNPNINGPWDLTSAVRGSRATIFVSNSLTRPVGEHTLPATGSCTIVRLNVSLGAGTPTLTSSTVIGTGFAWKINQPTFVLSPTGLAFTKGTLYVAQTLGNHVTAIPHALTRTTSIADGSNTVTSGGALNEPLGLVAAPNGNVIAVNGGDGNAVEITPSGQQIHTSTLVPNGAGALFGIVLSLNGQGLTFVNDGTNSVNTDSSATAPVSLSTANFGSLGAVLTGRGGRTLYYLSTESSSSIQCTGACTSVWPPLLKTAGTRYSLMPGLPGQLSTTPRADGTTQVTYNGHPIYFYSGDTAAGQDSGQGVNGTWFVMSVKSGTSSNSTTQSGGASY